MGFPLDRFAFRVPVGEGEALKVGDEMILTLEDEHILERNEHGKLVGLKKESQHTLQNVNRAEDDKIRRKRVELQEEQALHMGGDVADDFEYATGTSAATGVMAKYDDRTKQAHKLKIGSSGGLSAKDQSHLSGADIAALAQRMGKAPNAKMDTLRTMLTTFVGENDERVAVFFQSRKMVENASNMLDEMGIEYVTITGGTGARKRQANLDAMNSTDSDVRVILCTTRATGHGVNLFLCRRLIILSPDWNSACDQQVA